MASTPRTCSECGGRHQHLGGCSRLGNPKRGKAVPREVGFIDLLIMIRKLESDLFTLRERVASLEADTRPIGGSK